jgi:UDP-N-acetyl-alpha-D-muramoyl-L-alanyl-L-glutamate epimerase
MANQLFIFDRYVFDRASAVLQLHYRYEGGAVFTETITFQPTKRTLTEADLQALEQIFRLLFLLAGVSYYKAYAPPRLRCDAFPLDQTTADFISKVYRHGLGEFAYVNKLDLSNRINFETSSTPAPQAVSLQPSTTISVPVGGGKDSIVALECLKRAGKTVSLFALGGVAGAAEPIKKTITASGLPSTYVSRTIAPTLIELNKTGVYNGHVPITAILSVIAIANAIWHGQSAVVMSNEHSASAPNLIMGGVAVNHQYSKSLEFERDLANYLAAHISPDIAYFSLLRPLTEIDIARRFAALPIYHHVFRSCNTAFRQDEKARGMQWCGNCPKCRFVFLALAPFMTADKLGGIFGKNMLDDPTQIPGYQELCGLTAYKPFECVGEVEESALVIQKLAHDDAWQNTVVVKTLGAQMRPTTQNFATQFDQLFVPRVDHCVSSEYLEYLYARA